LEASETAQGFARKNRLAGVAAERVQPIVAFGAKYPHHRIGMPVRGGHNGGTSAAERSAPGGRQCRRRACRQLQNRQVMTSARFRAMHPWGMKGNKDIIVDAVGGR